MSPVQPSNAGFSLIATAAAGTAVAAGFGMLASGLIGLIGDGREVAALLVPGALAVLVGVIAIRVIDRPHAGAIIPPVAGFGAVILAWVLAAAIGSLPFLLAGTFGSPFDAYFEAMAGFTTAGSTLIDVVEAESEAILTWRSISQWTGGIGIVVLIVAIAPVAAPGLQRVFYAEASAMSGGRLTPRISETAKILGSIYVAITAIATAAFTIAGMGVFDAFNHAMTTVATGGFSTRTASLEAFDSFAIEIVAIVFMIVSGVNLAIYWRLIRGRNLMPQLAEVRVYLGIIVVASAALTAALLISGDVVGFGQALREASFTVSSTLTTTGFVVVDFDAWSGFAGVLILLLMVIGGCAGATSGGIKVVRVVLLAKSAGQELQRQTAPRAVKVLRFGGHVFTEETRHAVIAFFLIYVLVFVAGVIALTTSGLSMNDALTGVATSISGVGPGIGEIGALDNFNSVSEFGRVVVVFLMLAGRLEVFTVLALIVAAGTAARRRVTGQP